MTLREQVLAQAMLLAGELTEQQTDILGALCTATTASLQLRLREGLTPDDCKADFIAASSLLALAAMGSVESSTRTSKLPSGTSRYAGSTPMRRPTACGPRRS